MPRVYLLVMPPRYEPIKGSSTHQVRALRSNHLWKPLRQSQSHALLTSQVQPTAIGLIFPWCSCIRGSGFNSCLRAYQPAAIGNSPNSPCNGSYLYMGLIHTGMGIFCILYLICIQLQCSSIVKNQLLQEVFPAP